MRWRSTMTRRARLVFGSSVLAVQVALAMPAAQSSRYSAVETGGIVHLRDATAETTVSLLPAVGNVTFEMLVKGHNVLNFSGGAPEQFTGGLTGIPFMGPWANRLDEQAFYANGRKYAFDMQLGNVRGAIPIHGFLTPNAQSPVRWHVLEVRADAAAAWVTSELEFYKNPLWMKQFPFAHTIQMTHRLQDGALEIKTTIRNLSVEPMPVAIGFHPYFQLTDSTRDEWTASVGAKTHWLLAPTKVPTGETEPIEKMFPNPAAIPLKDYELDDVFGDLVRDADGNATMSVKGPKSQQLDVVIGRNYRAVVIWAPKPNREFICFEPMAGITDALNLAQRGLYKELQSVTAGGTWDASFRLKPRGF
jgi:aldose 1-epimerase